MRAVLLGLAAPVAALALPAAPANAQFVADPGVFAGHGVTVHRHFDGHKPGVVKDRDRRRHRRFPVPAVVGGPWAWPEAWALYNNRSWEPESFNDWWHERPWRSYPRWLQTGPQTDQKCERMWWSGGGWRC